MSKVNDFVEGNLNYLNQKNLPSYIIEQVELRKFLCNPCLVEGRCKICKCKTPNMFYSPNKIDSEKKWGPFLSEIQWTALKNNIDGYHRFINNLQESTPTVGSHS